MQAISCPNCGVRLETPGRFCPDCGVRLAGADDVTVEAIPPDETGQVPVNVTVAEPRYFGVTPPIAILVLAVVALALAIVTFATGHPLPGILLLVAAAAFTAAFSPTTGSRARPRTSSGASATTPDSRQELSAPIQARSSSSSASAANTPISSRSVPPPHGPSAKPCTVEQTKMLQMCEI